MNLQKCLGNQTDRIKEYVGRLQVEQTARRLMGVRKHPPSARDSTILDGGTRLGLFWMACKGARRCGRAPYDRLLTNPVLRTDYSYYGNPPGRAARKGDSIVYTSDGESHRI